MEWDLIFRKRDVHGVRGEGREGKLRRWHKRVLADGLKHQEEAGGPAAGDVVVGWINTATGQVWLVPAIDTISFRVGSMTTFYLEVKRAATGQRVVQTQRR